MVFVNAVAGCEDYNSAFYTQLGCANRSSDVKELLRKCNSLISEEDSYDAMVAAFDHHSTQNTAECIYNTLKGETECL